MSPVSLIASQLDKHVDGGDVHWWVGILRGMQIGAATVRPRCMPRRQGGVHCRCAYRGPELEPPAFDLSLAPAVAALSLGQRSLLAPGGRELRACPRGEAGREGEGSERRVRVVRDQGAWVRGTMQMHSLRDVRPNRFRPSQPML